MHYKARIVGNAAYEEKQNRRKNKMTTPLNQPTHDGPLHPGPIHTGGFLNLNFTVASPPHPVHHLKILSSISEPDDYSYYTITGLWIGNNGDTHDMVGYISNDTGGTTFNIEVSWGDKTLSGTLHRGYHRGQHAWLLAGYISVLGHCSGFALTSI
jgi:hypothetical protein